MLSRSERRPARDFNVSDTPLGFALTPRVRCLLVRLIDQHNGAVSAAEIDQYLDALEEPKRSAPDEVE